MTRATIVGLAILGATGPCGQPAQSAGLAAGLPPACAGYWDQWNESTGDRAQVEIAITKLTDEAFKAGPASDTLLKRFRDLIQRRQADRYSANNAAFEANRAGCGLNLPEPTLADGAGAGGDLATIAILNKVLGDR